MAATNLYQNVLRPLGLAPGPGLFSVAGHDNGGLRGIALVLSRNPEWAPRPEHRTLFELLAPHLTRALSVVQQHFEHRSGTEALLGIFDSLVLGVVLLDTNREVSFANQAAAQLLGVSAGLLPPGRAGVAERKRSTAALRDLYRRETGERRGMPSYAHPIDGRPLHILSTPLRSGGPADAADARFATALFLGDPSGGAADTTVALGSLYGLTPAEERLALRLASGKTLAEAAKQLGIQLSTARGVLRAVFAKTGTRRQAGLVRLVLTLVGQVRAESPRG